MLPKLQQSSLANTLRRENLASQIQCKLLLTKARINSRTFLENKIINPINHGKILMRPRILILLSEIFQKSIFLKKN
jgi:hypothetical protein